MAEKAAPTVFCEEVFDENSLPSEDEIRDYALKIGIQPDKEPHLLSLAKDGLMKALPSGWTPCFDHRKKAWYYFNYENGTSQWEHPLDGVYRDLVKKTRQESLSSGGDDISSLKDDLKSLDDASSLSKGGYVGSGALLRRATTQLGPLKNMPSKLEPIFMVDQNNLLSPNFKMTPRPPPSPTPLSSEGGDISVKDEPPQKTAPGRTELKVSGGGSSFLKKVAPQPSTDTSSSEGVEDKAVTVIKGSTLEPTRGILRDKSPQRILQDGISDKISDGEDEKKSVRFNLVEGAGVQIRVFEEEDSESKETELEEKQLVTIEPVKEMFQKPDFDFMAELDDEEEDEEDVWIFDKNLKVETDLNKNQSSNVVIEEILSENDNGVEVNANFETQQQKLQIEMDERIFKVKESLEKQEAESINKLVEAKEAMVRQMEVKIEAELKNREKNIREGAERTLEKLRDELASTMEKQLSAIKVEKQVAIDLEKSEMKKYRETLAANLAHLKSELDLEFETKFLKNKAELEKEHEEKLNSLRDQFDSTLKNNLVEQKKLKQADLQKQLESLEADQAGKLQTQHEQRLKEKKAEFERQLKDELARLQREAQSEKHKKMVALKEDMDRQLDKARNGLREDHNKILDKIKTDQLISIETLRMALQKEEEEMHVMHRSKLAALSEKLNAEYEARLKRLKEIADRKTRLLEEEDARASRYEHQGAIAPPRSFAETETLSNQRCEHLQRQVELLSIKLKDCRKQLEEARALRPDDRVFEKMRCEKRLLEDKYRTLKDKYVRLKTDVKQTLEKRNKKRLAVSSNAGGATTGSETDRSSSQRVGKQSRIKIVETAASVGAESASEANNNINNNSSAIDSTLASSLKESLVVSPPPTDSSDRTSPPVMQLRKAKRHQSKLKSCSTPRLDRGRDTLVNPVENLRSQLQQLEDLEDLFPASTHVDTYLRYPFPEAGQVGSCELEFFRHRIHLERDSVQKAKAFLKQQRHTFANRQRELHKRQSQMTLSPSPSSSRLHSELAKDAVIQEERELSEMEVSLHRTRSLLGEKIIRLRQLEHSLQQLSSTANRNKSTDATLSDLSSHSGSSGFSSNDHANDTKTGHNPKCPKHSESSEIIRSLETLNSDIRSLWDLLQRHNVEKIPTGPPPLLVPGSESPWPALANLAEQLQQIRLQQQVASNNNLAAVSGSAISLAERAQGLRDWLRRTKLDSVQSNSSKN
ncbi:centrosomal protein of 164 kDa [Neocloeon triangulifer]|uniref:centrosomal protein of 164 kDa n=1 Tax=Neocloeon triangulifer TaxID=2078957 RepID=UPI00286EFE68|nr:centrosomal protein of 164 kDa [Neocloeon triangulifer]